MKTITVGELRQNPTAMLAEVEDGETYVITRYGREIGRIVPPSKPAVELVPAKKTGGPTGLADLPPIELKTADSIEQLLDEMKGDW